MILQGIILGFFIYGLVSLIKVDIFRVRIIKFFNLK